MEIGFTIVPGFSCPRTAEFNLLLAYDAPTLVDIMRALWSNGLAEISDMADDLIQEGFEQNRTISGRQACHVGFCDSGDTCAS